MRHARAVLPYLVVGLAIATGSLALVFATTKVEEAASPPVSIPPARSAPELSAVARVAYWNQNPAGSFVLWAANFDGSSARLLVTLASGTSRPYGTRWTGDGRAVAFVGDLGINVVGLDGDRFELPLPPNVRDAGFRVIDQRWSPSGAKVAATVFRSTDSRSEVYLGSRGRALTRLAEVGSAFVADWISEDEFLVESTSGVLSAVREGGARRRIFDQPAASPIVDGGRIYFLAGAVTGGSDANGVFVSAPSVWSVTLAGGDARHEERIAFGDLRLDGRWPDGRYLVHVARDATQYLAGPRLVTLSSPTILRRVVVSPDRRTAIGFGGARLVRIDLTRGTIPPESAFVVLLDGIVGADAWVRRASAG